MNVIDKLLRSPLYCTYRFSHAYAPGHFFAWIFENRSGLYRMISSIYFVSTILRSQSRNYWRFRCSLNLCWIQSWTPRSAPVIQWSVCKTISWFTLKSLQLLAVVHQLRLPSYWKGDTLVILQGSLLQSPRSHCPVYRPHKSPTPTSCPGWPSARIWTLPTFRPFTVWLKRYHTPWRTALSSISLKDHQEWM